MSVALASLTAAALAALAASLAVSRPMRLPPAGQADPPDPGETRRPVVERLVSTLVAGALAAAGVLWFDGTSLALLAIAGMVAWAGLAALRRRRATRAAERRAGEVLAACEAMAADLASGQPPLRVLERAAEEWAELDPVRVAAQMGADVPTALRDLAGRPGAEQLSTLAATWQVAHHSGAGLADALARAAETMRARRRTSQLVASELAAARATARMLALLPVGVLAIGAGVGGDPVGFLIDTTPGVTVLGVGLALCLAGLRWLDHIADSVLRS